MIGPTSDATSSRDVAPRAASVHRASTLQILLLFARTAFRRMANSSAALQKLVVRKKEPGETPARTGTIGRANKQSSSGRLFGGFVVASMVFGTVMLTTISVITVVESVRLDEMAASSRIVLDSEEVQELRTAAQTPDEVARATAVKETLTQLSEHWTGPWTKSRFLEMTTRQYESDGLDGFVAGPAESKYRGDFALMSDAARARAVRGIAFYLMLFNVGPLCIALAGMNRSLSGADPILPWLLQFPVSRRVLFLARLIEQTFDTPTLVLNAVLALVPLYLCGAGFWVTVGASVLYGLVVAVSGSAVRLLAESFLIQKCGRKLRATVLSAVSSLGGLVTLFAMLGSGAALTTQAMTFAADRLPTWVFWNPAAPAFGSLELMTSNRITWSLTAVAMASLAGTLAVWWCDLLTADGLAIGMEGGGRTRDAVAKTFQTTNPSRPGRLRGLAAKEFLQVVRHPELLLQVLLAPVLILGLLYLKNPEQSLSLMTRDSGAVCVSIFAVAAYVLTGAAGALLALEFRNLWFLQTLPRSLADTVRSKARFWSVIVSAPVVAVCVWAFVSQPDSFASLAVRMPFLLAYLLLFAEVCFGSLSLGAAVSNETTVRFRRSVWFIPGFLSVECAAALYVGSAWSLVGTLILLTLVNVAIRQRQLVELPWISEPSDAPPRRLDVAHALIALGGFIQVRDVLRGVLLTKSFDPTTAAYLAFVSSAAVIAGVFLLWQWRAGMWPSSPMPKSSPLRPVAIGTAIVCTVGFLWVSVLRQSPDIVASAHLSLRLPTSLQSLDRDAWLRMASLLLVAPVFEEWLFRGLLFRNLRTSWSLAASVLLSALLFTVVHPAASSVGVFSLALVTALVYEKTGRLLAPIAVHFLYNLTIMSLWTAWAG